MDSEPARAGRQEVNPVATCERVPAVTGSSGRFTPFSESIMTLSDYRAIAKTGDLLGFKGEDFISRAIRAATGPYSHIGMVMRLPTFDQGIMVLLWESTTLNHAADWFTATHRRGVQTLSLTDKCQHYNGTFAVRRLKDALPRDKEELLFGLRADWKMDYEVRPSSFLNTVLPLRAENLKRLFCSELVAEALKSIGILRRERPADSYTPSDLMLHGDVPGMEAFYHAPQGIES